MAETIQPGQIEAGAQAAQNADQEQKAEGVTALPFDDAKQARYDTNKETDGKATAPARDAMFQNLTGVGESGTQGGMTGREDQNPVGPAKSSTVQPS